ncbi:hypothetical protein MRB53_034922 [Persea americana]|uniref:Uncharacterized protein n=1 Tax=Persea americana TaxID=3435 RepID=A0ACC2K388_PERAE|nr:hypothetical protein MRB53_034922 [Persea americana]
MSSSEQYLSDKVMLSVMEEKPPKDLWEKLEKLCKGKNLTNKLHLKKQLYGLKMEEGCDLMEHMKTFNRMISDLLRICDWVAISEIFIEEIHTDENAVDILTKSVLRRNSGIARTCSISPLVRD